ncbi:hypothetical protein ACFLY6_01260 [Candidatus Dependentiae bacterium]
MKVLYLFLTAGVISSQIHLKSAEAKVKSKKESKEAKSCETTALTIEEEQERLIYLWEHRRVLIKSICTKVYGGVWESKLAYDLCKKELLDTIAWIKIKLDNPHVDTPRPFTKILNYFISYHYGHLKPPPNLEILVHHKNAYFPKDAR